MQCVRAAKIRYSRDRFHCSKFPTRGVSRQNRGPHSRVCSGCVSGRVDFRPLRGASSKVRVAINCGPGEISCVYRFLFEPRRSTPVSSWRPISSTTRSRTCSTCPFAVHLLFPAVLLALSLPLRAIPLTADAASQATSSASPISPSPRPPRPPPPPQPAAHSATITAGSPTRSHPSARTAGAGPAPCPRATGTARPPIRSTAPAPPAFAPRTRGTTARRHGR